MLSNGPKTVICPLTHIPCRVSPCWTTDPPQWSSCCWPPGGAGGRPWSGRWWPSWTPSPWSSCCSLVRTSELSGPEHWSAGWPEDWSPQRLGKVLWLALRASTHPHWGWNKKEPSEVSYGGEELLCLFSQPSPSHLNTIIPDRLAGCPVPTTKSQMYKCIAKSNGRFN